jgi:hypothetical protein
MARYPSPDSVSSKVAEMKIDETLIFLNPYTSVMVMVYLYIYNKKDYKLSSQLQAQVSEKYGPGIHFLIPNALISSDVNLDNADSINLSFFCFLSMFLAFRSIFLEIIDL